MVEIIIAALVALILGGAAGFFIFRYVIKGNIMNDRSSQ